MTVMLAHRVETISFYVVERLTTQAILGCDFCGKHVEAIKPRQRLVEMDDETNVPILRTSFRKANAVPLPLEQEFVPKKKRLSKRLAVAEAVVIQPRTQTWVNVISERQGLVLIERDKGLFAKHNCPAATGVHQIEEGKPFGIQVGNFCNNLFQLLLNQTIARVENHPPNLAESHISHGELLGLTEENTHYKSATLMSRTLKQSTNISRMPARKNTTK